MRSTPWVALAIVALTAGGWPSSAHAAQGSDNPGTVASATDRPDVAADYTLGKEDVLDLSVVNFTQLTGPVTVRPDGKISVKLIGDVQAEGRTVGAVREEITQRMGAFIPDPHVDLAVKTVNSMKVFVMGRVAAPGAFSVGSNVNVLQALAMAKGFTPWAHKSKLVLVRGATGKRIHVNYDRVVSGREDNYLLYPGDTIVVP